jgi:hypothetical protein
MPFHTSSQLSLFVSWIYRQIDNAFRAELFGRGRRLLQKRTFNGRQIPGRERENSNAPGKSLRPSAYMTSTRAARVPRSHCFK